MKNLKSIYVLYAIIIGLFLTLSHTAQAQSALDGFSPNANGTVRAVVVQPDGKRIIGGNYKPVSTALTPSGFLYTLNDNTAGNNIYGYMVNEATGTLTLLSGFPVATGGTGAGNTPSERLTIDRANNRLYAVNDGSNTVSAYSIDPITGALAALPFSPVALPAVGFWTTVAVHPSGSPLVIGNGNAFPAFASYNITATTATATTPPLVLIESSSSIFSRDGNFYYTGGGIGNFFAGFSVNQMTGVLTPLAGSPFNAGNGNPVGYATDEQGRLFLASQAAGQVRAFTTASGVPTGVSGNGTFASGLTTAVDGALHPNGNFYVASDFSGNRIGSYQISGSGAATTLTAVSGSPVATGGSFTSPVVFNHAGSFFYAANAVSRNITTYGFNPTTGALTNSNVQGVNANGTAGLLVGMDYLPPNTGFLYALNDNAGGINNIYGYAVNNTSGGLTPLAGFPVATGEDGGGLGVNKLMTIDRTNSRLFVVNANSASLSAYSINLTTGALTELPFSPFLLQSGILMTIAVHPSGSPLIVGERDGSSSSYNITATSATPAAGSPFSTGAARPIMSAFSRDGNYFYTGGGDNAFFAGFSVNQATGVLTPLAGSPFDSGDLFPFSYATDTQGRLFLANVNAGQIRTFTTASGIPTGVTGNGTFASGLASPYHGATHPNGNFYVVTDGSVLGSRVGSYSIAGSGAATTLTAVGSPVDSGGTTVRSVAFNNSGTILYAGNVDSRNITTYSFNPLTGVMTNINVQTANTNGTQGRLSSVDFLPTVTLTPPPTAASVSIGGRVLVGGGRGLTNAFVTLTDSTGNTRTARTNQFGYYRFNNVAVGETYVAEVSSKRYQFAPQVVSVSDDITGLNFTAIDGGGIVP